MGNCQLRLALFHMGQARQPYLTTVSGFHMDLVEGRRAEGFAGLGLQHHSILAGLGVDGGDLALAEGVIQRIGDGRDTYAQARGRVAVDHQVHLQAFVLQVTGHVGEFRQLAEGVYQLAAP